MACCCSRNSPFSSTAARAATDEVALVRAFAGDALAAFAIPRNMRTARVSARSRQAILGETKLIGERRSSLPRIAHSATGLFDPSQESPGTKISNLRPVASKPWDHGTHETRRQ